MAACETKEATVDTDVRRRVSNKNYIAFNREDIRSYHRTVDSIVIDGSYFELLNEPTYPFSFRKFIRKIDSRFPKKIILL